MNEVTENGAAFGPPSAGIAREKVRGMSREMDVVLRAAAFLDSRDDFPDDWRDRIDVAKLDLSSTCNCICGQATGGESLHERARQPIPRTKGSCMSEVKKSEVRDVLVAAKELIADPKDWCGDGLSGRGLGGSMCVAWALYNAAPFAVEGFLALPPSHVDELSADVAGALGFTKFTEIWAWNDDPATTHEMVMDAFDRAIESVGLEIATREEADQTTTSDAETNVSESINETCENQGRRRPAPSTIQGVRV